MALLGYARVSTDGQELALQEDALNRAGVDRIFTDKASGTLASRPGLDSLLAYARENDTIVVWRLDRLGRSTRHVLDLLHQLSERGVLFRSITEGLDTTGPMGKVMITMIAAFAELERDIISERTRAGLKAARERGAGQGGRPRALSPAKLEFARTLRAQGKSAVAIATELGVGRATIYRALAPTPARAPLG
ncbi:recombinase family protein [Salinibacterium sp. ZJ450]|uniref:recombinase family protein n=1 Tax=Salinibacterium sp. ZJ450 TaxID=2708338 RepID=UPI0014201FF4|nr:recombinase family protein [Salinibacterium sp. ZJ450]